MHGHILKCWAVRYVQEPSRLHFHAVVLSVVCLCLEENTEKIIQDCRPSYGHFRIYVLSLYLLSGIVLFFVMPNWPTGMWVVICYICIHSDVSFANSIVVSQLSVKKPKLNYKLRYSPHYPKNYEIECNGLSWHETNKGQWCVLYHCLSDWTTI